MSFLDIFGRGLPFFVEFVDHFEIVNKSDSLFVIVYPFLFRIEFFQKKFSLLWVIPEIGSQGFFLEV
jgi:hypothetical protein